MEESAHFADMLKERGIKHHWVDRTLADPERVEKHEDGTHHFAPRIPEYGGRWLRVIINATAEPKVRVTAFFDRRLRKRHESQGRQEK